MCSLAVVHFNKFYMLATNRFLRFDSEQPCEPALQAVLRNFSNLLLYE
nr:MAG TPA: hypothetical protein [Caudoviricetes sp.]